MSASKTHLYHRLQLAAHRLQKESDRLVLASGAITTAQAAVLAVVAGRDATQRDVAELLGINESAVTAMVNRLANAGLLERERDGDDARVWRLRLSRAGRAALKRIDKPFGTVNQRIEAVLSAQEIEQLAGFLDRISGAFDEKAALEPQRPPATGSTAPVQ